MEYSSPGIVLASAPRSPSCTGGFACEEDGGVDIGVLIILLPFLLERGLYVRDGVPFIREFDELVGRA